MQQDYWYVGGEAYDLKSFASVHPGGKEQLLNLQGRDISEMVHTMHSMVSQEKVQQIMSKYKVAEAPSLKDQNQNLFQWSDQGLYHKISKRVVSSLKGKNYKFDIKFWLVILILLILELSSIYLWVFKGFYIGSILAGLIILSGGFMVLHTAGHCGLSSNPKTNTFWFNFYSNYIFGFPYKIWDIHHNYAHHCYTNIHRKDPDVSNALSVIRKNESQTFKPQHQFQWATSYLLLLFFPNQWLGQVIQYFLSIRRQKIFGLPMMKRQVEVKQFIPFFMEVLLFTMLLIYNQGLIFTLISLYLYSSAIGFGYWYCVFPNHDTDYAEHSTIDQIKGIDWGEHQIRHTSDFKQPSWVSYLMGGMNYQIEHHLFPTIHPRHYPMISKIVEEECKLANVPYHVHSSWIDALRGNYRQLVRMSKQQKKDVKRVPKIANIINYL